MNLQDDENNTISIETDLIQIGKNHYCRLSDINGIQKVYHHPDNKDVTDGYPMYQVCFDNDSHWNWVLVTCSDFEKYIYPLILNKF